MQTNSLAKGIYSALLSAPTLAVPRGGLFSGEMLLGVRRDAGVGLSYVVVIFESHLLY